MSLSRTLEKTVKQASQSFPVLMVTGPRQVGKSTLLEMCAEKNRSYISLDAMDLRKLAKTDPALFLQEYPPPVVIDEIQYAPELFSQIKLFVDQTKKPGLFWLTGSQKFHLMKNVSESLAGRVAVIDMLGFSCKETMHCADQNTPFLPTRKWLTEAKKRKHTPTTLTNIYKTIWRGSFPKLIVDKKMSREMFYNSYIQTYIERDVKDFIKISDTIAFANFIVAVAARTAQLLNYADLARDVGVDQKTVKSWLSVLEASGLVMLLQPYHNNISKRIIKTPKLYFLDTGLAAFLTNWNSPQSLEKGAMSGAILETHVFLEILKSYWHCGRQPNIFFYRDIDQVECDFVLYQDDTLYPVEIKKTATPSLNATSSFATLKRFDKKIGHGMVVCFVNGDVPLSKEVTALPVGYL